MLAVRHKHIQGELAHIGTLNCQQLETDTLRGAERYKHIQVEQYGASILKREQVDTDALKASSSKQAFSSQAARCKHIQGK